MAKVPEVDPSRIYVAGHSSAGTVALLTAEHEPRIAGCIAYAPCSDVEDFLSEALSDPFLPRFLPGLREFAKRSSPRTHVAKLKCPTFLFQAADDSVVDANTTRQFRSLLQAQGTSVTYKEVPSGDHYDPMIESGIPAAIAWINGLANQ
ncbi:MAG: prolyl oligopeptidase family serine peptidase [Planctomycetaceae bacterium]